MRGVVFWMGPRRFRRYRKDAASLTRFIGPACQFSGMDERCLRIETRFWRDPGPCQVFVMASCMPVKTFPEGW